jgi:DNA-binding CsgD family transcriptional regulator
MDNGLNIPFELLLTAIQFTALWLLFYKLYFQESKTRRVLLVICMVLYRLSSMVTAGLFFPTTMLIKILLPAAMYAFLVVLAGGRKKTVCITAVYHWSVVSLIDLIMGSLFLGLTGNFVFSSNNGYLIYNAAYYTITLLWAIFYYSVMREVHQEALNRMSLTIWLTVLLTPAVGVAAFYAVLKPFIEQLKTGFNNFRYIGFFCIIILAFNLVVFYLFIKLVSNHNARLLAGELNKTPPLYTTQNGISSEFIEKYGLSNRQVEITEALLQGKSNKEISVLMEIEVNTVQVHLQNVYKKTGAPGRYALMALFGLGK